MKADNTLLSIESLSKSYKVKGGELRALSDLSLEAGRGEILGILGPNGAGKTTLLKLIMGFIRPTQGKIRFQGKILRPARPRPCFGYLPENFSPNPGIRVHDYIRFQIDLASALNNHLLQGDHEIERLLNLSGMQGSSGLKISELSKGMGQRVGLSQVFVGDPDFLVLDEPTSGLDPIGKEEMINLLLEMKKRKKTILFCSHILSEVERLCDRIGILVHGRLKFWGTCTDFMKKWNVKSLEKGFLLEAG